jgi:hypothetical protein
MIRSILLGEINRAWAANRYGLDVITESSYGENVNNGRRGSDPPLKEKITRLLQNRLLPTMTIYQVGGVCLLSSTIDLLKKGGLDRISMPQLADLTGFEYREGGFRINGQVKKAVGAGIDALAAFLE